MKESEPIKSPQGMEKHTLFDCMFAFEKKKVECKGSVCGGRSSAISSLREGDILIVESEIPRDSLLFRVTRIYSNEPNISNPKPSQLIFGVLEGALISDTFDEELQLLFSVQDNSPIQSKTVRPGSYLCFGTASGEGFVTSSIMDYGIGRENKDGVLEILTPNELEEY